MNSSRRITWAGIEFQPNLKDPRKPVPLGVLLTTPTGSVLLGRQPIPNRLPPEFEGVGPITLDLAANWIDSMWKDFLEGDKENPFPRLSERWRWNLYIVQPAGVRPTAMPDDLLELGEQLYRRFVKEPFRLPRRHKKAHRPPAHQRHEPAEALQTLPAWVIEENMKRTSTLVMSAHA